MPARRRTVRFTCFLLLLLPILAPPVFAATLQGRVIDPQQQPVAAAKITVDDQAKAIHRDTATDPSGQFTVPELPPGTYSLSVEMQGFGKLSRTGLTLEVGQTLRLELSLELAGVSDTIEAVAEAPTLTTTGSSVVSQVIDRSAIETLPLNGRNFLELSFLVPGNVPTPNFDPTKTNSVVVASAGQFGRGGMITIDGADNNDDAVGGPLQNVPEDSVQEFQIATNRYSAETGRSAASVINVVTRSGTDNFHGDASFYMRDDSWQALPATYDRSQPAPPFDRQQYAAALGGPIEKGSLHWFAAVEVRDQNGAILVGERDVETRTISNVFAGGPLQDVLATARLDWSPSSSDRVTLRWAYEDADSTGASTLERSIGSASQRQESQNLYNNLLGSWIKTLSGTTVNTLSASYSRYRNDIQPVAPGTPQLTFPSIQDGASFRVPQATNLDRLQLRNTLAKVIDNHNLKFGGEAQLIDTSFDLGVFQSGRIEMIQDFANFDHNGDGQINDNDLLFSVTLRSGYPDRDLLLDGCDNTYVAVFAQDDWWVTPQLTLNLGLRWEMDTNVKNISGYPDTNPLVKDFYQGDRKRDDNNFGPRIGFNYATSTGRIGVHGGWGIYYDRITLEVASLEKGLDGRALPIEVRAGNVFFLDPETGLLPPFAPSLADPFTGFILPGAGASGINIIDNAMQTPEVQQWNLGVEARLAGSLYLRADGVYNHGTNFIIGRPIGTVFNPVVGGPDRVLNLESSVGTEYKGLFLSLDKRVGKNRFMASYTLSKSENYTNDDQIPFGNGPVDPNDLEREFGPSPNDRRHYFTFAGAFDLPMGFRISPLLTLASGVPMDILMPSGETRVPTLGRNAGGRRFTTGAELNDYLRELNQNGGIDGVLLPLVSDDAEFSDDFSSLDLRVSKVFQIGERQSLEAIVEVFNLLNVTNVLGLSTRNYSGYANVLTRDSQDPTSPGYLVSSSFGQPVSTAGGVFGSGGPRAFQLGIRYRF